MVQGSTGVGLTLVAGPLLVAIDSDFVPGPLQSTLAVILGVAVVVSGAAGLIGLPPRAGRASTLAGGALSAFGAVSVALPGPPFVICYQPRDPRSFRPTIAAFVTVLITLAGLSLFLTGTFGRSELTLLGYLLPGLLVGILLSARLRPVLDRGFVRPAVLILSFVSGALLVLSELL